MKALCAKRYRAFFFLGVMFIKQSKTSSFAVCLFLYIPVVWLALFLAQSLGGGLPDILAKLSEALENPLDIHWTPYSTLSILACTGVYVMALLYRSANQGRTREGEEHGAAIWATPLCAPDGLALPAILSRTLWI